MSRERFEQRSVHRSRTRPATSRIDTLASSILIVETDGEGFVDITSDIRAFAAETRAASGLKDFDLLLTEAAERAPLGELVDIMDVGFTCGFLATPFARRLSGETLYVDGGVHIMG